MRACGSLAWAAPTVISFSIDPSFAGNLLVQASGFASGAGQSNYDADCYALLDGSSTISPQTAVSWARTHPLAHTLKLSQSQAPRRSPPRATRSASSAYPPRQAPSSPSVRGRSLRRPKDVHVRLMTLWMKAPASVSSFRARIGTVRICDPVPRGGVTRALRIPQTNNGQRDRHGTFRRFEFLPRSACHLARRRRASVLPEFRTT